MKSPRSTFITESCFYKKFQATRKAQWHVKFSNSILFKHFWVASKESFAKDFVWHHLVNHQIGWIHFSPMFHFYIPWKHYKSKGFLKFQGVQKWNIGIKWVNKIYDFPWFSYKEPFMTFWISSKVNSFHATGLFVSGYKLHLCWLQLSHPI